MTEDYEMCPFCGNTSLSNCLEYVQCNYCGARGPRVSILDENKPRQRWNNRVEPNEIPGWLKRRINGAIINCQLLEDALRDTDADMYDIEEAVRVSRRANTLEWVLSLKKED